MYSSDNDRFRIESQIKLECTTIVGSAYLALWALLVHGANLD
jgi:hypothetical protein